jgi:hypothetical protein
MKKLLWLIPIGLILFISFASSAQASVEHYKKYTDFRDNYVEAYELKNTDGNERLMLKELADIERASAKTVHYDERKREHFVCTWLYNEVLGRWVCGKDYGEAQEVVQSAPTPTCDVGYKLNENKTGCVKVDLPTNAHLNNLGNGWQCNSGYHLNSITNQCIKNQDIYVQPTTTTKCSSCATIMNEPQPIYVTAIRYVYDDAYADDEIDLKYVDLADTGVHLNWIILISFLASGSLWGIRRLIIG